MARKIFYSWQSDLPNATNRGFIHTALEAACAEVAKDVSVEERPEVDRDTQGVPGAPDIASTIFGKIDAADVFLADISIVAQAEGERPCPNPNVLIELGYAIRALSWERVLLVMNTAYGGPELLPFDLKTKRVMPYSSEAQATERAPERKKLQGTLKSALTIILQHLAQPLPGTEIRPESLRELACAAIEAPKPNMPAAVRRFMQWFANQLAASNTVENEPDDEVLVRALESTQGALAEFGRLAEAVAEHDSKEAAQAVFKGFEYVLLQYDPKAPGDHDRSDTDFDLAKFVGHEAFVTFIALLMREGRWHLIAEVLSEEVIVKNVHGTNSCRFDLISTQVKLLAVRRDRLRLNRRSLRADLLKERHENGELSKLVPFTEFMAADLLLFLRGQLESEEAESWGARWIPWSSVFLERGDIPRFLIEAKRSAAAAHLALALGMANADELRQRFAARMESMNKLLRGSSSFWDGPFRNFNPAKIGTR